MLVLLVTLLAVRVFLPVGDAGHAPVPPGAATATPTQTSTPVPTLTGTPTASPTVTSTPTPLPPDAVFVLAGQSNMGLWDTIEVERAPEDANLVLAAGSWRSLEPGHRPTSVLTPNGPGLAFGRAVARSGHRVGLIGCAVPGTSITQWQKGRALYDDCLAAVRATGRPVAGVVVYQGEADAFTGEIATDADPTHWAALFGQFVADWRRDTAQPDLPVVYARLAHATSPWYATNWTAVQAQQDQVALPGVTEVDVEPVVLRDPILDGVHLDDASYALVGERLAAAWLAHAR